MRRDLSRSLRRPGLNADPRTRAHRRSRKRLLCPTEATSDRDTRVTVSSPKQKWARSSSHRVATSELCAPRDCVGVFPDNPSALLDCFRRSMKIEHRQLRQMSVENHMRRIASEFRSADAIRHDVDGGGNDIEILRRGLFVILAAKQARKCGHFRETVFPSVQQSRQLVLTIRPKGSVEPTVRVGCNDHLCTQDAAGGNRQGICEAAIEEPSVFDPEGTDDPGECHGGAK